MYFERSIDQELLEWSRESFRKPLVLRGARQTGKTASLRRFGKRFDLYVELNLERFEDAALVRDCQSVDELLIALRARLGLVSFPKRTLLFFDEIQEDPKAIGWLRFLHEDHPDLYVVAAGSLLEVRLLDHGFSFPVGRVTFRRLRPFTYSEFLKAMGEGVLVNELRSALQRGVEPPRPLHQRAMDRLRDYLLVGGMPEAVVRWAKDASSVSVRTAQRDLLQALAEDVQKYGGSREGVAYLEAAFENLRHHYGLRFRYENFAPGYRSRNMKDALGKLEAAMLIQRIWPTSALQGPMAIRPRSAPKLQPLDVGLALSALNVDFERLRRQNVDTLFEGRVSEIFVGQQLLAGHGNSPGELFFWVAETSRNNAEIDFLLEGKNGLVPIEVKAGASGTLKSLHQFLWRSGNDFGIRLYSGPWRLDEQQVKMPEGQLHYRLLSLPLYLAEYLPLEEPV